MRRNRKEQQIVAAAARQAIKARQARESAPNGLGSFLVDLSPVGKGSTKWDFTRRRAAKAVVYGS